MVALAEHDDGFEAYMVDCVGVIQREIAAGCTQKQVAQSYAWAIKAHTANVEVIDWPAIHAAIRERWSDSAVERIKKQAWKHFGVKA